MKIKSEFAILDVKKGRKALFHALLGKNPRIGPSKYGFPVTITGYVTDAHGGDDGVSREFQVEVTKVELGDGCALPAVKP